MTYHLHPHPHRLGWAFVRQYSTTYEVHRRESTGWRCVLVTTDRERAMKERDA